MGAAVLGGQNYGSTAFTPLALSNLVAWFDFSDLTTLFQDTGLTNPVTADGQSILGITDKSGTGNNFIQAAGPLYKANIQSGRGVGRFNGSSNYLADIAYNMPANTPGLTIITAVNIVAETSNGVILSINTSQELRQSSTTGKPQMNYKNAVQATWGVAELAAWHIQTGYYDGANVGITVDNGIPVTSASTIDNATRTGAAIGARPGGSLFAQIDLGELIICNSFLSVATQSTVNAYLKAKWGTP